MRYKQREYITVHAFDTPQADFETESIDGNGLAILIPKVCSITEELNGTYELYMEHPLDPEGRWKLLEVDNIIKAEGQLFRIKNRKTKLSANGEKVRAVQCLHIWYDLAGKCCPSYTSFNFTAYWFVENLRKILNDPKDPNYYYLNGGAGWYKQYDFFGEVGEGALRRSRFTTDCGDTIAYAHIEPANIVNATIGTESSFVNVISKEENGKTITPEIYRNNFMWSLNWRKQHAQDNAFSITHKIDMQDIEEDFDTSNYYTHLHAYDNYGHFMGENISGWAAQDEGRHVPRQPRVKIVKFQYTAEEASDGDLWSRFQKDFWRYFRSITQPRLTIKCNYAELSDTDLYKDYIEAKHCNVGDSGTVYCEDLGISQVLKVIRKKRDLVDRNKVETTFGSKLASITSPEYMSQTINNSKFTNSNSFEIVEI